MERDKTNQISTINFFTADRAMEEEGTVAASQSTPARYCAVHHLWCVTVLRCASVRRGLWRDTQQQSVGSIEELQPRWDITTVRSSSVVFSNSSVSTEDYCPLSSPQLSLESPRISFSPLQIKVELMIY